MTVESAKCPAKRTGLRSIETWAIVALLVGAGMAMGYPLGQLILRGDATAQVSQVRDAYEEASKAKDGLIRQCLAAAGQAAETASKAADTAETAAGTAATAAETAKSAAEAVKQ